MLDLNFVRDNLALVEEKLRQRGMNPAEVLKDFRTIDAERRQAITAAETLQARRNALVKEFQGLKFEEKRLKSEKVDTASNDQARAENLAEQAKLKNIQDELKKKIQSAEKLAEELNAKLKETLNGIPNLPHASVPVTADAAGSAVGAASAVGTAKAVITPEGNVEARRWGTPPQFDFTPKPHWELGEQLRVLDLERAAKLTGARFAVYWALGARLERALANFMLDLHTREHGYTEVLPPYLVNSDSMYGTGQLPKFEQDLFKVRTGRWEKDPHHTPMPGELVWTDALKDVLRVVSIDPATGTADIVSMSDQHEETKVPWSRLLYERVYWLIPTAEVPVTNLYRDEVLDGARLPISLTAYTPCFRSEAGSYGKDVRGIIRQHQFQKVELVKFSRPENSYDELEKLTHDAETVLQKLGLHYRVVTLCTADMGFSAAKTYDLEVWLPGQNLFREISSCSNFESFQARRANIRYRPEGKSKTEFVHTLNGSGLAVGRTWVAIVENYQQADGSVRIPEALQPYMGTDRIPARSGG
ncbi:MAG TPA: serine--tRNA ligase [Terriglobales bacterium]|nr:serine--tRNA ligase [Terriglobales bacterium]HYW36885.1 serine--tRNA ligase [Terriglobales bacterium]